MVNGAGAGKGHYAKAVAYAVAQFGLGGGVVTVAETAVKVATHQFVAAQGRQQVKRRLAANHAGMVNIKAQHQAFAQGVILAPLNTKQPAIITIAAKQPLKLTVFGGNQNPAGGIGIVIPAIEGKAWPQKYRGTAASVLQIGIGIKNARFIGPAKLKVIPSRKETQVNMLAKQLFATQINPHPFLTDQLHIGLPGIAPNAIIISGEVDIPNPGNQMEAVMRQPVIGAHTHAALPLSGHGSIGKDVGHAGMPIHRIGIKGV